MQILPNVVTSQAASTDRFSEVEETTNADSLASQIRSLSNSHFSPFSSLERVQEIVQTSLGISKRTRAQELLFNRNGLEIMSRNNSSFDDGFCNSYSRICRDRSDLNKKVGISTTAARGESVPFALAKRP